MRKTNVNPSASLGYGVVLGPNVTVEENVYIGSYCVIGTMPEHRDFYADIDGETWGEVVIRKGARIFEFTSINAGTCGPTYIGEGVAIQNHAHIGHSSILNRYSVIGGHASLAGHVEIMEHAIVGGRANIHQYSVVGAYGFLAPTAFLKGFVPPGELWASNPARPAGLNDIGLKRAGISHKECLLYYKLQFEKLKMESKLK